jgi:long-chain acyl-CoA synthetase
MRAIRALDEIILGSVNEPFSHFPCAIDSDNNQALTYQSARQALLQYRQWIELQLKGLEARRTVIGFLCSNSIDYFLSVLAACGVGEQNCESVALLNTRWTCSEIVQALQKGPTLLIYSAEFKTTAETVIRALGNASRCVEVGTFTAHLWQTQWNEQQQPRSNSHDRFNDSVVSNASTDDAVIVFTSGTTSGAKGVRLSHRSILVQARAKLDPRTCGYSSSTRVLGATVPFFHVGGLSSILAAWMAGGAVVIPAGETSTAFSPSQVLCSVVNTLVVVPAMLYAIKEETMNSCSISVRQNVQLVLIGGQSASSDLLQFCRTYFPKARLVQTYACTEAASSLTFLDVTKAECSSEQLQSVFGDCVGTPPRHVELSIVDATSHRPIQSPYTIGLIATRGDHVMNGFWKRWEDRPSRIQNDWLILNDLGFWDKQGQRALEKHPKIQECTVFGIKDRKFGEAVCCAIVMVQGEPLSIVEVRDWCKRQGLAGYKCPRYCFVVERLPRNSSGKILKFHLTERFSTKNCTPQSKL